MEHLTDTQLNDYLDGTLESAAQARMAEHFSTCADCQARLASLQTVFKALASLPEEMLERDLTSSVLRSLPRSFSKLGWRLALAVQVGISLGFLLLFAPILMGRFVGTIQGVAVQIAMSEVKFPAPADLHFSLPIIQLPHPRVLSLPVLITHANMPVWITLGIAAVLLFVVGNYRLIFHNSSEMGNNKRRRMP